MPLVGSPAPRITIVRVLQELGTFPRHTAALCRRSKMAVRTDPDKLTCFASSFSMSSTLPIVQDDTSSDMLAP